MSNLDELTDEQVVRLSISHMLNKRFHKEDEVSEDVILAFISDYSNYIRYLNDYMGVICKKFDTDLDEIYYFVCDLFDLECDNKSLFDFRLKRLLTNTPMRVLSMANNDMKEHTFENMQEEFDVLISSRFYQENISIYSLKLEEINSNIQNLKKILGLNL